MTNLITGRVLGNKKSKKSVYAKIGATALLLFAVLAPLAVQKFLTIDPTVVGLVGIPMIILLGFVGSVTVIIPVPVLPLVFTGGCDTQSGRACYRCRCEHYCGHGRLLHTRTTWTLASRTYFGRVTGQFASSNFRLLFMVDRQCGHCIVLNRSDAKSRVRLRRNYRGCNTCGHSQISGRNIFRQDSPGIGDRISGTHRRRPPVLNNLKADPTRNKPVQVEDAKTPQS